MNNLEQELQKKIVSDVCSDSITTIASENDNLETKSDYLGEVSDLNDEDKGIFDI